MNTENGFRYSDFSSVDAKLNLKEKLKIFDFNMCAALILEKQCPILLSWML